MAITKIIKNVDTVDHTWDGRVFSTTETATLLNSEWLEWNTNSNDDIDTAIDDGNLQVGDGTTFYTAQAAKNHLNRKIDPDINKSMHTQLMPSATLNPFPTVYVSLLTFRYAGTLEIPDIPSIVMDGFTGSYGGTFKIYDATNSNTLKTHTMTKTTRGLEVISGLTSLPTSPALIEVQYKSNTSPQYAGVYGFAVEYF